MHAPTSRSTAVALALGAVAAAMRVNPIFDPDYFWHLATGALVLRTHAVPRVDPWSHTYLGAPWRFVDWLADVLMHLLHRLGGDPLVVVAFAAAGGLAVVLCLPRRVHALAALAAGSLLLPTVVFRISPRPQTLTLPLLAAELLLLSRGTRRALLATPVLLVVWQNVHSSALLGWLVLVGHAVGVALEVRARRATPADRERALVAAALGLCALFVAVRPLDRLLAGFDHLGDARVALLFDEWAPLPKLRGFYAAVPAYVVLVAGVLGAVVTRRGRARLGWQRVVPAFGLAAAGFATMRFLPLAGLALAPLFAETVDEAMREGSARLARFAPLVLVSSALGLGLLGYRPRPLGFGWNKGDFPVEAAAFVRREQPAGKLYNDFHWGGFVIHELGLPVFVDGRSMAVYGVGFVLSVATANDERFGEILDKRDVAWALAPMHQRTGWFQRRPGWALVYFDDVAFVAVRARENPGLAARLAYRALDVAHWQEAIPALRADPSLRAAARAEAERAIAAAPSASFPWVLLASVELAADDGPAADRAIAEALRREPSSARAHRAKLVRCVAAGDQACTCAEARAVLTGAPKNAYALARAKEAGCP